MSGPVKRKPGNRNGNEEFIHMAGASPEHELVKPKKSVCACTMSFLYSTIKIVVFVGSVLVLLSMLVSVRKEKAFLEDEVQRFQAASQEVQAKYTKYEVNIEGLNAAKMELTQSLGGARDELSSKQEEVDDAIAKHEMISTENNANKERLNQLINERTQLEETKNAQINQLSADLEVFKGRSVELGTALDNERINVNQLTADLQASRATADQLQSAAQGAADAQAVSNENNKLKEQVGQLTQQVNDQIAAVNAKHQHIVNLENERNTITEERNTLSQHFQAKEENIKQLQQNIANLEAEKQGLLARIPAD